ncbi:MAG: ATP-binding cassette domain-containing protein, partial [Oscillospiraceae bacterium]|nr:ATP-binding cassette domain-containing protein [Oscillospiraceae bacterium]
MRALHIEALTTRYEGFTLESVSFELEAGYIMGFIGRNGAGKSTTIKSIVDLVHPDEGSITVFGADVRDSRSHIKQQVGLVLGEVDYYP